MLNLRLFIKDDKVVLNKYFELQKGEALNHFSFCVSFLSTKV